MSKLPKLELARAELILARTTQSTLPESPSKQGALCPPDPILPSAPGWWALRSIWEGQTLFLSWPLHDPL